MIKNTRRGNWETLKLVSNTGEKLFVQISVFMNTLHCKKNMIGEKHEAHRRFLQEMVSNKPDSVKLTLLVSNREIRYENCELINDATYRLRVPDVCGTYDIYISPPFYRKIEDTIYTLWQKTLLEYEEEEWR